MNSKRLVALIVFSGILAFATSASAECAWVLWQRVDSFDARGTLVPSPTSVGATYTTSAECITAIDTLERQWQSPQAVVMRDAQTIRPGEALAVRRQDVNTAGIVHVQGSHGRRGRGPTKNPYSVRKVSVLYPVTEDRAVWRPKDAGITTRRVLDGLALLTALAPDAESRLWPISQTGLNRTWKLVLKAAGVPYRKPHALRHSFASILLSRGANLLAIQKAGGWRSAQVLLTTYAHYMPDQETATETNTDTNTLDSSMFPRVANLPMNDSGYGE